MSQVTAQVKINAPTEKVWEVLVDAGRFSEWLPNDLNKAESLSRLVHGASGPKHYHHDLLSTVREQSNEWEPGRSYSYVVNNVGVIKSAYNSFYLNANGEGTLLTQTVNLQMKYGPVGSMIDSLVFQRQFRKQMATSLIALKDYVEDRNGSSFEADAGYALAA